MNRSPLALFVRQQLAALFRGVAFTCALVSILIWLVTFVAGMRITVISNPWISVCVASGMASVNVSAKEGTPPRGGALVAFSLYPFRSPGDQIEWAWLPTYSQNDFLTGRIVNRSTTQTFPLFYLVGLSLFPLLIASCLVRLRRTASRKHHQETDFAYRGLACARWALTLLVPTTLGLWIVSISCPFAVFRYPRVDAFAVEVNGCAVQVEASRSDLPLSGFMFRTRPFTTDSIWLPSVTSTPSFTPTTYTITLPFWLPLLFTSLPAALLWRSAYRRHILTQLNLCPCCRYSLTGLSATAPCPECGTARTTPPIAPHTAT